MFVCMATGFFMMLVIGNDWSITSAIVFGLVTSVTDTKDTSKFLGKFLTLFKNGDYFNSCKIMLHYFFSISMAKNLSFKLIL